MATVVPLPTTRVGVTFELDRLELDGARLIVGGRWRGVRGLRFVRPTLVVGRRQVRALCLRRPGATEDFPFGPDHSVFKVAGKMFALSALDRTPLEVSVKCEPDLAAQLRRSYAAIRPGYHLNKRHWNTITLDDSL